MRHANPKYEHIQDPTGLIPVEEPVFLLRATDPCTPAAIFAWLQEAHKQGVPNGRCDDVFHHLQEIRRYQARHPDLIHLPGTQR